MKNFLIKGISSNLIALLLSTYIIISCMNIYCADLIIPVSVLIFVIQALVFSFYTFLSEKSMLLRFVSVLGSFACIIGTVIIAIKTGQNKSSYDYFVWFLSPQALVSFSKSYIIATFIIINFFISSTIYYFSAVRYRLSMSFLITLIPFAFYRKEGVRVPAAVAFVLLFLYVLLMIHCKNVNTKPGQKMIIDNGYRKSIIYFIAAATLITAVIPKPEVNFATSVWLSTLIDSEKLSDYMLERLGIASTTSSSYTIYSNPTNTVIYHFLCDEQPLNLKSQTYSEYDSQKNSWRTTDDDIVCIPVSETDAEYLDPSAFYSAVAQAASSDDSFAEKYGLSEIADSLDYRSERKISMTYARVTSKVYLVPTLTSGIDSAEQIKISRSNNGMIQNDEDYGIVSKVSYFSGKLAEDKNYQKILGNLNMDNYGEFLDDLAAATGDDSQYSRTLSAYVNDYNYSREYLERSLGFISPNIASLAEKITEKYSSDYQKAMAIQNYFTNGKFVYDMNYQKSQDFDMETFLFEDKRGVCSDFATSMAIMARSVGIPSRYAEGVNLKESESSNVTVTDADLHAFPELFIAGYGWMTFEPTQAPLADKSFFSRYMLNIIIALVSVLLILLTIAFYLFFFSKVSEKIFEIRISKKNNEDALRMIAARIRKKMSVTEGVSSSETVNMVVEKYNYDTQEIFDSFDSVVYGGMKLSDEHYEKIHSIYCSFYDTVSEYEKMRRKGK